MQKQRLNLSYFYQFPGYISYRFWEHAALVWSFSDFFPWFSDIVYQFFWLAQNNWCLLIIGLGRRDCIMQLCSKSEQIKHQWMGLCELWLVGRMSTKRWIVDDEICCQSTTGYYYLFKLVCCYILSQIY